MYFWKWNTFSWNYLKTAFERAEKTDFWKLTTHRVAVVLGADKPSSTLGIFHMTSTVKVLQISCQSATHWPSEIIIILILQMGKTEDQRDRVPCLRLCSGQWQSWDSSTAQTTPKLLLIFLCYPSSHWHIHKKWCLKKYLIILTTKLSVPVPLKKLFILIGG